MLCCFLFTQDTPQAECKQSVKSGPTPTTATKSSILSESATKIVSQPGLIGQGRTVVNQTVPASKSALSVSKSAVEKTQLHTTQSRSKATSNEQSSVLPFSANGIPSSQVGVHKVSQAKTEKTESGASVTSGRPKEVLHHESVAKSTSERETASSSSRSVHSETSPTVFSRDSKNRLSDVSMERLLDFGHHSTLTWVETAMDSSMESLIKSESTVQRSVSLDGRIENTTNVKEIESSTSTHEKTEVPKLMTTSAVNLRTDMVPSKHGEDQRRSLPAKPNHVHTSIVPTNTLQVESPVPVSPSISNRGSPSKSLDKPKRVSPPRLMKLSPSKARKTEVKTSPSKTPKNTDTDKPALPERKPISSPSKFFKTEVNTAKAMFLPSKSPNMEGKTISKTERSMSEKRATTTKTVTFEGKPLSMSLKCKLPSSSKVQEVKVTKKSTKFMRYSKMSIRSLLEQRSK